MTDIRDERVAVITAAGRNLCVRFYQANKAYLETVAGIVDVYDPEPDTGFQREYRVDCGLEDAEPVDRIVCMDEDVGLRTAFGGHILTYYSRRLRG